MSQLLCFFFLLSFFSIFIRSNGNYSACYESECNGVEIKYPFWLQDDATTEQYCGYPGFGLNCTNSDKHPIINLPSDSYYVSNISYEDNTLNLIDIDVVDIACPRVRHNFSVEALPVNQSALDLNLTFYFNCSEPPPLPVIPTPIPCLASNSKQSYVVEVTRSKGDPFDKWYKFCEDKVVVAVKSNQVIKDVNGLITSQFNNTLTQGFLLDWNNLSVCAKCEAFYGRCGFNNKAQQFVCFCEDGSTKGSNQYCKGKNKNLGMKFTAVFGVAGATILVLLLIFYHRYCHRHTEQASCLSSRNVSSSSKDVEGFLKQYGSSAPERYGYTTIKKITNSFRDELGKGGYGSVYKGCLSDGRVVAVKVLNPTKGKGEEFLNEVASIGRTSHVNVVKLLGFCYEGRKRALIYDYMPNGSLEKFIFRKLPTMEGQHLGWDKLYSIALGIAQGLDYLHRGCNTRILHFDIKPHNILLDKDFRPKISDFGLAKLYNENESNISSIMQARGTIGYIAPEVFSRNFGQVSHKSDVYSYGMMILEMVGGRKNVNAGADHTSEIYYPRWLYKRIAFSEELHFGSEMSKEETEIAKKMVIVGLWCIQTNPAERPYINKVIEMLEGKIASLEMPPKPYLCSPPNSPSNSQAKPLFNSNSITDFDLSPEVSSRLTIS